MSLVLALGGVMDGGQGLERTKLWTASSLERMEGCGWR